MFYAIKLIISAALIVIVSEVSKHTGYLGGLLASLPLISYLAIIWLYVEKREEGIQAISNLSMGVFWFVLPTLPFFLLLPVLLKHMHFAAAMAAGTVFMFGCYAATMWALGRFGIEVV